MVGRETFYNAGWSPSGERFAFSALSPNGKSEEKDDLGQPPVDVNHSE
jgi:hypothetical protein